MTPMVDVMKLSRIFMPHFSGQMDYLEKNKIQLAYYTSSETASKLITTQELWLRDCRLMNDSEEVSHGIALIERLFADPSKSKRFRDELEKISPGVVQRGYAMFQEWKSVRKSETFLISFSRHAAPGTRLSKNEGEHGRLSMWRGYGGNENVAMIFNVPFGQVAGPSLMLFFSSVGYFDSIDEQIEGIASNIAVEKTFLSSVPVEWLANTIFLTLVMGATCLKHPGFAEEDEWRLIYLPSTWQSRYIRIEEESIRGKRERVCKLPISAFKSAGISGMDLGTLIDRVIVGPTQYPEQVRARVIEALNQAGVSNAEARVRLSGIPFRRKY